MNDNRSIVKKFFFSKERRRRDRGLSFSLTFSLSFSLSLSLFFFCEKRETQRENKKIGETEKKCV